MGDLFVGCMSGTSFDGMDLVLLEIEKPFAAQQRAFRFVPYPDALKAELLGFVANPSWNPDKFLALDDVLGQFFGQMIAEFLDSTASKNSVRAIGLHGQTVWHSPERTMVAGVPGMGTLQLGNVAQVQKATGISVVHDFRKADMAHGGQGAPLAPFLDKCLFQHPTKGRMALNIGGIANVTFLPPNNGHLIAFDTGPGNMISDALMARHPTAPAPFDSNGTIAGAGCVIAELLASCLADPYFARMAPKSTGREHFGEPFVQRFLNLASEYKYQDLIATAVELTAQTIADAIHLHARLPQLQGPFNELIVSGGGAHNTTLMKVLAQKLPQITLTSSTEHGVHPDAKEAWLMAALAWAHVEGVAGNIPSVTGANQAVVLGSQTA